MAKEDADGGMVAPDGVGDGEAPAEPEVEPESHEPLPEEVESTKVPKSIAWEAEKALKRADAKANPMEPWRETPDHLLTPAQEQEIRDFYGYTDSEKRTRAERQAVADRMTGKGTATEEDLRKAYEQGYALEAAPFGSHPAKGREGALTTAWAKGVWQRQAEAQPARSRPDMTAKPNLQKALDKTRKGKNPWGV